MPKVSSKFIIQHRTDSGEWIDVDEHPVKLRAEVLFSEYKKKIPRHYAVRFVKRTDEILDIRPEFKR